MNYQERNREVWSKSAQGRRIRATQAELAGYPAQAAVNYILGIGPCPWNRHSFSIKKSGVAATTTGAGIRCAATL